MKKSGQVQLTLVAAMALAGCGLSYDPCRPETFNPEACQQAIYDRGYYYHGSWSPMRYSHSYPYYYNSYAYHVSGGGLVRPAPFGSYSRPAGVARGGFGSTGSHGAPGQ